MINLSEMFVGKSFKRQDIHGRRGMGNTDTTQTFIYIYIENDHKELFVKKKTNKN